MNKKGKLYIVATPIGNLGDISSRAIEILRSVKYIACEDTRTAKKLMNTFNITGPKLVSYYDPVEETKSKKLVELLKSGNDVALITESGTPLVSDPGYLLVKRSIEAGIDVVPIPGPCAAIAALSASGLPPARFVFAGFPPKKQSKLKKYLNEVLRPGFTTIFYIPARRVEELLQALHNFCPDSQCVIARELTKQHEEFLRGTVSSLLEALKLVELKGECVLLVYISDSSRT